MDPGPTLPVVRARRGMALIQVLMFTFATTAFLIFGVQFITNAFKASRGVKYDAQAYNVALAGINHAVYWLRKQTVQPVVTPFDPQSNTNHPDDDPETAASEEQLGLVSEFPVDVTRNIYGRYEIGRSNNAPAPAPTRTPNVSQTGSHTTHPNHPDPIPWTAEDISAQCGQPQGYVWRVRCKAYVYDTTGGVTFDLAKQLASLTLEAEIRRTSLTVHESGLYAYGNQNITLDGDNSGLDMTVADGQGRPYWTYHSVTTPNGGPAIGTPPLSALSGQSTSTSATYVNPSQGTQVQYIFGTSSLSAVQGLADQVVDPAHVPYPQPSNKFIYIKGDVTFDSNHLLSGGGILFVEGKLTINSDSTLSSWNGLVFATSDVNIQKKCTINGALVTGGTVTLKGDDNGRTTGIHYSAAALGTATAAFGEYRLEHSTLRVVGTAATPTPL